MALGKRENVAWVVRAKTHTRMHTRTHTHTHTHTSTHLPLHPLPIATRAHDLALARPAPPPTRPTNPAVAPRWRAPHIVSTFLVAAVFSSAAVQSSFPSIAASASAPQLGSIIYSSMSCGFMANAASAFGATAHLQQHLLGGGHHFPRLTTTPFPPEFPAASGAHQLFLSRDGVSTAAGTMAFGPLTKQTVVRNAVDGDVLHVGAATLAAGHCPPASPAHATALRPCPRSPHSCSLADLFRGPHALFLSSAGLGSGYENLPAGFSLETILLGAAPNGSSPYPGVPSGGANHAMRLYGDTVLRFTGKPRPPSNVDAKNRFLGEQ